jgi:hypothetical protein
MLIRPRSEWKLTSKLRTPLAVVIKKVMGGVFEVRLVD